MTNSRIGDLDRRDLLKLISAVGAAGIVAGGKLPHASALPDAPQTAPRLSSSLAARAARFKPAGSDLGAIEHVVFLMMENRSYDHYFGTYHKGRGFDDHPKHSLGNFEQHYPAGTGLVPAKRLLPFKLPSNVNHDCTADLTHNWGPMHECWNHGKMDQWTKVHTSSHQEGSPNGALTMGYYTRNELPFYHALADHFTLCDGYHCSVLGPTHPNRLMWQSGMIDPAGQHGGPVTDTNISPEALWSCKWSTVQEQLEDAGIPWKVYSPDNERLPKGYSNLTTFPSWAPAFYDPTAFPETMAASDLTLPYFKAFENPNSAIYKKAFNQSFPYDFVTDLESSRFPKVSWIIPPIGFDEHPAGAPHRGQYFSQLVLDALVKHPEVWKKTVMFLMYDENDGFFDHVAPPTAPKGTEGEWLTANSISSETLGIRGPIGLGVRVPCLVISPFSRGGHIASEVFDHTSQLKFLSERFGIELRNVSKWRRETVGDLTSTLFRSPRDVKVPKLPRMQLPPEVFTGVCQETAQDVEGLYGGAGAVIPKHQRMPTQHGKTLDPNRFGHHHHSHDEASTDGEKIQVVPVDHANRGPRSSTARVETGRRISAGAAPHTP